MEEFRAVKHLTDESFARSDVCIRLNPNVTADIPLTCLDLFFDLFKNLGIMVLHHLVKNSLALTEGHFGILVHKGCNVAEGSCTLADAFLNSPEPRNVDMAVTREDNSALCAPINFADFLKIEGSCFLDGFSDLFIGKIVIYHVHTVVDSGVNLCLDVLILDEVNCIESNREVKIIAFNVLIGNGDIRISEKAFLEFCTLHSIVAE